MTKTWFSLFFAAIILTGCGGSSAGHINTDTERSRSPFAAINLNDFTVQTSAEKPDLSTTDYRTHLISTTLLPYQSSRLGTLNDDWGNQDEPERMRSFKRFYMMHFELTQDQWHHVMGTEPWLDMLVADDTVPPITGGSLPALGLSQRQAESFVAALNTRLDGWMVRLPHPDEWEHAARANSEEAFSWGADRRQSVIERHAVLRESQANGPAPVGQRAANAWGLYDMHGNVAELTNAETLCGGAWFDTSSTARAANNQDMPPNISYIGSGFRLILIPINE